MTKKFIMTVGTVFALSAMLASVAFAGIPFAPFSTCTIGITQTAPLSNACTSAFSPPVVRLCPGGTAAPLGFDTVSFDLVILDALANPVVGATLSTYELFGNVNIATAGATTDVTSASGSGTVTIEGGGGCGNVGVCADGVLICEIEVRSADVALSNKACTLPAAGTSFINASDYSNGTCGYVNNFGPVTPGINNCWDTNCSGAVEATDITGKKGQSGLLNHFGHGGPLGATSNCPAP